MSKSLHIALLPGDGIGPEVTSAARRAAEVAAARSGMTLEWTVHPFGGAAIDETGDPLPDATWKACRKADAILLGAIGGPVWDGLEPERRPEQGLLALRKALGAFANLRPVSVPASLAHLSVLPRERVSGTDLLVVRELTGGIYFGEPRAYSEEEAFDTMRYTAAEVDRIARVAFKTARSRRGKVTSVDKANVLASSRLWRQRTSHLHRTEFSDVELEHMYVDNAAMQVVRDPLAFDVILTSNLFGDILSDLASTLAGSLGVLPSASIGGSTPLFEPVHGSAPDLAGRDRANPMAAMFSAALLFENSGFPAPAALIRRAVDAALAAGCMTGDLSANGVSTTTFTHRVCAEIERFPEATSLT